MNQTKQRTLCRDVGCGELWFVLQGVLMKADVEGEIRVKCYMPSCSGETASRHTGGVCGGFNQLVPLRHI